MGIFRLGFAAVIGAVFLAASASAGELRLIMVEQNGCHWCERWHSEIGPIYPKTSEGRAAALQLIDLHRPIPVGLTLASQPRLTPTFILTDEGEEVSRLEGYPGEDFFWALVAQMIERHTGRALEEAEPAG